MSENRNFASLCKLLNLKGKMARPDRFGLELPAFFCTPFAHRTRTACNAFTAARFGADLQSFVEASTFGKIVLSSAALCFLGSEQESVTGPA
jgi:hypothetical protein